MDDRLGWGGGVGPRRSAAGWLGRAVRLHALSGSERHTGDLRFPELEHYRFQSTSNSTARRRDCLGSSTGALQAFNHTPGKTRTGVEILAVKRFFACEIRLGVRFRRVPMRGRERHGAVKLLGFRRAR